MMFCHPIVPGVSFLASMYSLKRQLELPRHHRSDPLIAYNTGLVVANAIMFKVFVSNFVSPDDGI